MNILKRLLNALFSGTDVFWIGPDLYLTLVDMDSEVFEVWVSRDSFRLSVNAGTIMRKDFRKTGFPECLTTDIRNSILEKANAHLARSSERIFWDDSGNLNIEY